MIYGCLTFIETIYLRIINYSTLIVPLIEVNLALIAVFNSKIKYVDNLTFYFEFKLVSNL